jgi:xanthine/uracil/vitamin C permease (AzgA family)
MCATDLATKDSVSKFEYTLPLALRSFEDALNRRFKLEERGVTVKSEFIASLAFFVSCIYVLPVVPANLMLVRLYFLEDVALSYIHFHLLIVFASSLLIAGWL